MEAAPNAHLISLVAPAAPFEGAHNVEQVVVRGPASGIYEAEVIAEPYPANNFNQLRVQPFALVFVGSGQEVIFGAVAPPGPDPGVLRAFVYRPPGVVACKDDSLGLNGTFGDSSATIPKLQWQPSQAAQGQARTPAQGLG